MCQSQIVIIIGIVSIFHANFLLSDHHTIVDCFDDWKLEVASGEHWFLGVSMKRIKIGTVEPGDILFTARPGKLSKTIRGTTGGTVSHAMICVQHGSFIDSTSDGVQARNLQRELFADDEEVYQFRLKETPTRDVLSKVLGYTRAQIGTRYSLAEAARSVGGMLKPRSNRQFCSRLVARAFKEADIDLVPDADYCSPEDLRRSEHLIEILIETEEVSEEYANWLQNKENPVEKTHKAQNTVLDVARSFDPTIENFNDLHTMLVEYPKSDLDISTVLRTSGYLDLWKIETELHPWRYDLALISAMVAPHKPLQEYCLDTVKEAYSGGIRFATNLVQLRAIHLQHPRTSFQLLTELYQTLVQNDQKRREVAYAWLSKNHPGDLKQNMEQIEPHSDYWFSVVDPVEPKLAALSRHAIESESNKKVCSSCGDEPAIDYRIVNGAEKMPGVPSLGLCDDCIKIRTGMGNVLIPFLR